MTANQRSTVVGVFDDRIQADKAVSDLQAAGFRPDQIGVAMRHTGEERGTTVTDEAGDTYAGEGAVTGVVAGLGLGALAGLGVLSGVIPVIGPAIAAGTLGVILSNAAAGAGIAGLVGALIGAGVPEEEAKYYHSEFEAGRTIVTVKADGRYDEAMAILRRHGAHDMTSRGSMSAAASTTAHATDVKGDTIQVKEERLHAEKRPVDTGEVRVRKEVHTETKTMEVPVQREEVVVERTPVHGQAAGGFAAGELREGEEIRIPVREEQVDVTKDAAVVEEVKVGKRVVQDTERVSGQVRKEEIKIDRTGDVDVHSRTKDKGPK